tara:strand:- start:394 stop:525 length:132 start_codon:yes stop_codon:yes gene_type:complete
MRSITTMTMHKKNSSNWSEKPVKKILKDDKLDHKIVGKENKER